MACVTIKQTSQLYKVVICIIFFICVLNGASLWMIGTDDPFKGQECICDDINYFILNVTENGSIQYEIHYDKFCPITSDIKNMISGTYSNWTDAYNHMQYEMQIVKPFQCCVTEMGIEDHCEYNFIGAIGSWWLVLGISIPCSIWLCSYCTLYELNYARYIKRKDNNAGTSEREMELQPIVHEDQ